MSVRIQHMQYYIILEEEKGPENIQYRDMLIVICLSYCSIDHNATVFHSIVLLFNLKKLYSNG